jgi:hypothetical protein
MTRGVRTTAAAKRLPPSSARKNDEHEGERLTATRPARLRREFRVARAELVAGRTAPAKRLLEHIARTAARARTSGVFTVPEAALIEGNATYILSRL